MILSSQDLEIDTLDPQQPHLGSILIVDDMPVNLRLLLSALKQRGYQVRCAIDGATALNSVKRIMPDLILVDVLMPKISGFQVCEAIKSDPVTAHIPVLFLSAINTVEDKVKAFESGGADYITKPFFIHELLKRVEYQLQLRALQQRLELQNQQLQKEIGDRQTAQADYRAIFEHSLDGIFQSTVEGRLLSANPSLAQIHGYDSPDDLIKSLTNLNTDLYVQPKRRQEFVVLMQHEGSVSNFESQIYRRDGSMIWISETARVVKDELGNPLYFEGSVRDISEHKKMEFELILERQKSERLLLNILPQTIAEQLKRGKSVIGKQFPEVTVLFADIVQFTPLAATISPTVLVERLNAIFSRFDELAEEYGVEKIKTIGDEYMAVCGVPNQRSDHAEAIADMALAMQEAIAQFQRTEDVSFQLRIGINTGEVVAGVIGTKKFSYDLWGDTVNIASRMESSGVSGKIQVTPATHHILKHRYEFSPREPIFVKGKGEIQTYWLDHKKTNL